MSATVFLDCETLGLDRMAPIWEFAALRIDDSGAEVAREHFQIRHDPSFWLDSLDEQFVADYRARYDTVTALWPWDAAKRVAAIVKDDAVIAGSNPAFDMERLLILLQRNGFGVPGWHYHPCDVPTMALGWLARGDGPLPRPWKSDVLSRAVGVDPDDYARHTALGDVLWTRDLYNTIIGGAQ